MLELSQVSMNQTIIRDGRAAGIIPMPMTGRLGGVVARRLKTAGQLAAEFGSVWQDQGFAAASKATAASCDISQCIGRSRSGA